mmetsp:Transcript_51342/g.116180  ORF Transcript_51342/g.116180 Transcript_51342/m.116180 type:complete len:267 (+) Transcript_51342:228-1028(+)
MAARCGPSRPRSAIPCGCGSARRGTGRGRSSGGRAERSERPTQPAHASGTRRQRAAGVQGGARPVTPLSCRCLLSARASRSSRTCSSHRLPEQRTFARTPPSRATPAALGATSTFPWLARGMTTTATPTPCLRWTTRSARARGRTKTPTTRCRRSCRRGLRSGSCGFPRPALVKRSVRTVCPRSTASSNARLPLRRPPPPPRRPGVYCRWIQIGGLGSTSSGGRRCGLALPPYRRPGPRRGPLQTLALGSAASSSASLAWRPPPPP